MCVPIVHIHAYMCVHVYINTNIQEKKNFLNVRKNLENKATKKSVLILLDRTKLT